MRLFIKRQWPLIGLGILLGVAGLFAFKAGREAVQRHVFKAIAPGEGLKLSDIHYTHDDPDKRMKWILDAREVSFSEDKSSILFHDFKLRLEPEGRAVVTLSGKMGDYVRESGVIKLSGEVKGVSGDGYKMSTDRLLFNEREGYLETDENVWVSGPFFSVKGRGLFVDLGRKIVRVLFDVTTVVDKGALIS